MLLEAKACLDQEMKESPDANQKTMQRIKADYGSVFIKFDTFCKETVNKPSFFGSNSGTGGSSEQDDNGNKYAVKNEGDKSITIQAGKKTMVFKTLGEGDINGALIEERDVEAQNIGMACCTVLSYHLLTSMYLPCSHCSHPFMNVYSLSDLLLCALLYHHLSIAKKTADLNALFMDVAELVEEQQEGIDEVVNNTETADSMTKEGLGQLEQAHRTQRTTGKVFCYFSVFLIIIAGGVVGAMILMKKV